MKKRYALPIVGAVATVGVGFLMKNKNKNDNSKTIANSYINAGIPDQIENNDLAQLENAKMVSEGSQFGVQYFNETAQEEMEELSKRISE